MVDHQHDRRECRRAQGRRRRQGGVPAYRGRRDYSNVAANDARFLRHHHPPLQNADHRFRRGGRGTILIHRPDVAVVGGEPPPGGVRREESPPLFFRRRFFRRDDCRFGHRRSLPRRWRGRGGRRRILVLVVRQLPTGIYCAAAAAGNRLRRRGRGGGKRRRRLEERALAVAVVVFGPSCYFIGILLILVRVRPRSSLPGGVLPVSSSSSSPPPPFPDVCVCVLVLRFQGAVF